MRRIALLTAVTLLMILALLVTGCGETGNGEGTQLQIATIATAMAPITDWDPAICTNTENQVFCNTYETLLLYESDTNTYKPVLATEYSKSDDGLVWTFKLREGVKFHDGTDFNAEAVKFSIERTKNGKKGMSYLWDCLDEVRVIDEYTVEFVLNHPAPLEPIISCAYCAFIYSPTVGTDFQKGTDWFSEGREAGTGPYMIERVVQGNEVVLTKFDDYWGGWEGQHFDKAVFKMVEENASRRQIIESGEADSVTRLLPEDVKALQSNPNVDVIEVQYYRNLICLVNTEKPPLDNKLVRQALAYAFPYQGVVDYVKLGLAEVPTDTMIPGNLWGATDSMPYTYDLDKAEALLTEAGYPDGGLKVTITVNAAMEDRKKCVEMWKSELAKINVNLDIRAVTYDGQLSMASNPDPSERQHLMVFGWYADPVDPSSYYSMFVPTDASWNYSYYKNSEIDKEIQEAYVMSCLDIEKSIEMYQAIGQKLADECICINFCDEKTAMINNKTLKGYKPNLGYTDVIFLYDCYREQ